MSALDQIDESFDQAMDAPVKVPREFAERLAADLTRLSTSVHVDYPQSARALYAHANKLYEYIGE